MMVGRGGGRGLNNEEFEEFVRRNPEEALRLIVKAFKPKELLKIGDRSYVNAFKYPESRFDPKDLMPNGGSLQVLKEDMLQPLRDPSKTFTDQVLIPPSQLVFPLAGKYYRKSGLPDDAGTVYGGLTDASTVIQSAINALTNGGKIFIKAGTYIVADINVTSNIELVGEGFRTILRLPNMTRKNIINVNNAENVLISNLLLDGNWQNQDMANWSMKSTGGPASTYEIYLNNIFATNSQRIVVKDVYTKNAVHDGVLFQAGVTDSIVQNVYVTGCQWHGIGFWQGGIRSAIIGCVGWDTYISPFVLELTGGAGGSINSLIANCVAYDSTGTNISDQIGIGLMNMTDGLVIGNVLYNSKIQLYSGAKQNLVVGNRVYVNGKTHGIRVTSDSSSNIIANNWIYNPYYDGIRVESSNNNVIGNIVANGGPYSNAIRIIGKYNMIASNQIMNWSYQNGILEDTGADYNSIVNNVFTNVTVPKIVKAGANTIVNRNIGYVTENSGTATITAGSTYVDVTHGLSITPDINKIRVTPKDNLGGCSFWVSNVTSTTFRINISSTDTVDHSFGWSYEE